MKTAMAENLKETPAVVTGWWGRGTRFLAEVRNEMSRVTWPNRREVWATTVVVILTAAVFGVFLWGVDLLLSQVVPWIIGKFA